jgi:hypothetical protein
MTGQERLDIVLGEMLARIDKCDAIIEKEWKRVNYTIAGLLLLEVAIIFCTYIYWSS